MLRENLSLLLLLYRRPRSAMSAIIDEGSVVFGAVAVVLVALLFSVGASLPMMAAFSRAPVSGTAAPGAGPAASPPAHDQAPVEDADGEGGFSPRAPAPTQVLLSNLLSPFSLVSTVAALAVLYAPAILVLVGFVAPVGSFSVALRRDLGPLLACTFMAWAASHLPFALGALLLPALSPATLLALVGLWAAAALLFAGFMVVAVQTVFGARAPGAVVVVAGSSIAFLLQPFLSWLASPFLLYCAYRYFQGDIGDVTWSFRARQSFKRYLHAATLNPRDAEAHLQLGLIHQQRHQLAEARERFRRAVEIDPSEVDAHYQLGRLARQDRQYEEAIRHFEKVVARDDRHAHHEVWREIGATYLECGSLEHARWALDRFVAEREHDPEGRLYLGRARAGLGDAAGAAEQFRLCVDAADTAPGYRRREVAPWRRAARDELSRRR